MLDFGCCTPQDDITKNDSREPMDNLVSDSDSMNSFDDHANTRTVDYYKEVTPLFKAIEQEDWKSVLIFLTTGRWNNSPFTSSYNHLQDPSPQRQARTWVQCIGSKGEIQWRQLPIHAAISYLAPLPVVQKLVEIYRDGVRSADDTGNLPLHLAFGFGSSDNVVAFLMKEYPQALSMKGLQRRRPVDCCDLGPNKVRGEIISACQEHTRATMMKEWDQHWKKSLRDAKAKAGLVDPFMANPKSLEEVFNELVRVKMELKDTKEMAKNRPTMIITKTEPVPHSRSLGKSPSELSAKMMNLGKKTLRSPRSLLKRVKSASGPPVAPTSAKYDL